MRERDGREDGKRGHAAPPPTPFPIIIIKTHHPHPPILLTNTIAIPFIVHPIDNAIHALLNVTLRPALKKAVCEGGQGKEAGLALCEECGPWKKGEAKKGMH